MSVVYKFLDKSSGGAIENKFMSNQELMKNYTSQLLENLKNKKYTNTQKDCLIKA